MTRTLLSPRTLYVYAAIACVLHATGDARADSPLRRAASLIGLTPTQLAACGLSAGEVTALFAGVAGTPQLEALLSARDAADAAEQALATTLKSRDPLNGAEFDVVALATSQRAAATAHFESARSVLLALAVSSLAPWQQQRIAAWRSAPATIPPELKVVAWTGAASRSLRSALLEERLALESGVAMSTESAVLLLQVRSRTEVADAITRLQSNLTSVSAAFEQAVQ